MRVNRSCGSFVKEQRVTEQRERFTLVALFKRVIGSHRFFKGARRALNLKERIALVIKKMKKQSAHFALSKEQKSEFSIRHYKLYVLTIPSLAPIDKLYPDRQCISSSQ